LGLINPGLGFVEFVQNKGLLGGLLLLLPQRSNESGGGDGDDSDENVAKALAELEQWLVHNTFQVCALRAICFVKGKEK